MLTPFGKALRRSRDERGVTLKEMADALGKPSSYMSAMEHGRKPIPKQLIHQVHEYFGSETYTLKDWIELSDASPLQLKLNLVDADEIEREVYMAVAKRFHSAPHEVKEEIRQFISERLNAAEGHEKEVHRNGI